MLLLLLRRRLSNLELSEETKCLALCVECAVGESHFDGCSNCVCLEGGLSACTRKVCLPSLNLNFLQIKGILECESGCECCEMTPDP